MNKDVSIAKVFGLSLVPGEIGIEIEMEGTGLPTRVNHFWRATSDGSLRGEAVEYVLAMPIPVDSADKVIDFLATDLSKSILSPSHRCGVHIHFNCQTMTVKQVIKFAALYFIFEEALINWCGPDRECNLFCLRAKDAEHLLQALIEVNTTGNIVVITRDFYRYSGLNFASLGKFGSLEFRALATQKSFENIKIWIQLLNKLKQAAMSYESVKHIVDTYSAKGAEEFVHSVYSDYELKLISYNKFSDSILSGIRRIQTLIYDKPKDRSFKDETEELLRKDLIERERRRDREREEFAARLRRRPPFTNIVPMSSRSFDDHLVFINEDIVEINVNPNTVVVSNL